MALAHAYGAKVAGVAAIVDRSTGGLPLSLPVRALIAYPARVTAPDNCDLCARRVPLSVPGSGESIE